MAVNHVIQLKTGGTVVVSMDGVNLLACDDNERSLLQGIGDVCRQYERQVSAERVKAAKPLTGGSVTSES